MATALQIEIAKAIMDITNKKSLEQHSKVTVEQSTTADGQCQAAVEAVVRDKNGDKTSRMRCKRKSKILFEQPFFELPRCYQKTPYGKMVIARCLSCGTMMRGSRYIFSNFVKHMQTMHPEKYKLYDKWKFGKTTKFENASESNEAEISIQDANNRTENTEMSTEVESKVGTNENNATSTNSNPSSMTLEQFNTILDIKIADHNKQNQVTSTMEILAELRTLKSECRNLREYLERSEQGTRDLQHELTALDRELHQHELLIRDLPLDEQTENPETVVEQFFENVLGLSGVPIDKVIMLSNKRNNAGLFPLKNLQQKPRRSLIVHFQDAIYVQLIKSNLDKLKFTGIFIEPVISQTAFKRKIKLLVLRREMLRRNAQLKVSVSGTQLIVAGQRFDWDVVNGFCVSGAPHANAVVHLQHACGLDMGEFLNILKNYNIQNH